MRTKPADDAFGNIRQVGVVAERLAGVHVRQMHLDKGNVDTGWGVAQSNTGVGEGGGVDDDKVDAFSLGLVNAVD